VELAVNRAFTTLSYGGIKIGVFGDGQNYENGLGGTDCITELNSARLFCREDHSRSYVA
jgi:hypothetical protein